MRTPDIVVFDPQTIRDRGTYSDPARNPVGIRHVFVNGVPTLLDGQILEGVVAGQPVRAERVYPYAPGTTWNQPGE